MFRFLKAYPKQMFIFIDQRACLTYEEDVGEVLYLIGAFDTESGSAYNTKVAMMAKAAQMN